MDNRDYLYPTYADGIPHPSQFQQTENNFVKQEYQGPWESSAPFASEPFYAGQNQYPPPGYGNMSNNYCAYPPNYPQSAPEYPEFAGANIGSYPHGFGAGTSAPYPGSVPLNHLTNSYAVNQFPPHYYPSAEFNHPSQVYSNHPSHHPSQVFNNHPYLNQPREDSSNFGKYKTSNKPSLAKPYTKSNHQESSLPPDPFYGNWWAIAQTEDAAADGAEEKEKVVPQTILNFERDDSLCEVGNALLRTQRVLCENLQGLTFNEPVAHVYSPAVYAFQTYKEFIRKYCTSEKKVLFVGINPGPWGMVQSGVPFGERAFVRDWLEIQGLILKPAWEHPKRPILGLECTRSEVSGKKLWTLIKSLSGRPENFFQHCFLHNICPLSFLSKTGSNITPPDILPAEKRNQLNQICDASLTEVIRILKVEIVVAIGRYVETRVKNIIKNGNLPEFRVECLAHPSPLNRKAGNRWAEIAEEQLREFGVLSYIKSDNTVSGIKQDFSESEASEQDSFTDGNFVQHPLAVQSSLEKEQPSDARNPFSDSTFVKQEPVFDIKCTNQVAAPEPPFLKQEPVFDAPCTKDFAPSDTPIIVQNPFSDSSFAHQEQSTKVPFVEPSLYHERKPMEPGLASDLDINSVVQDTKECHY